MCNERIMCDREFYLSLQWTYYIHIRDGEDEKDGC